MGGDRTTRGRSGVVRPRPLAWHQKALATLIWLALRTVAWTVRMPGGIPGALHALPRGAPVIFCVWHNRLALVFKIHGMMIRHLGRPARMAAMVSASRDGGMLARILRHGGIEPVRGSTSRRGPQALLEMTKWARRGYDLAITPDGPRGPCYQVHPGVISLAQATGLTVVPVAIEVSGKLRLRSWDRFQVPLPLSRCELRVGEFLQVPREASEAEREALRRLLESRMRELADD